MDDLDRVLCYRRNRILNQLLLYLSPCKEQVIAGVSMLHKATVKGSSCSLPLSSDEDLVSNQGFHVLMYSNDYSNVDIMLYSKSIFFIILYNDLILCRLTTCFLIF